MAAITYNEFCKLVPARTSSFTNELLKKLYRGIEKYNFDYSYPSDKSNFNLDSQYALLLQLYYGVDSEASAFMSSNGFKDEIHINYYRDSKRLDSGDYERVFEKYSHIFLLFEHEDEYAYLTPERIINEVYSKFKSAHSHEEHVLEKAFGGYSATNSFHEKLAKVDKDIVKRIRQIYSDRFFQDSDITTINYMETTSKVFHYLRDRKDNIKVGTTNRDLAVASLLVSLYYYSDISNKDSISKKDVMIEYLKEHNVSLDSIANSMGINFSSLNYEADPVILEKYFSDLFEPRLSVEQIVERILNRSISRSLTIEKILAANNCSMHTLNGGDDSKAFSSIINERYKLNNNMKVDRLANIIYNELPGETINYVEFTTKVYTLILDKFKDNKANKDYITSLDDLDTLSILISSYFYDGNVSRFFAYNGVKLDNIFEALGFKLTRSEIEQCSVDQNFMVSVFNRFIFEGVNKNKSKGTIGVNDVINNLCNRSFNNSNILKRIFNNYGKQNLDDDFFKQLSSFLVESEQLRKHNLTEKIYNGLSYNTIDFLDTVSRYYQSLLKSGYEWRGRDLDIMALLYAMNDQKNTISLALQKLGLTSSAITKYLRINSVKISDYKPSIDIINDHYLDFLSSEDKTKIDIEYILKQALSGEIYTSVNINRMLGSIELDQAKVSDFDKIKKDYEDGIALEELQNKEKKVFYYCGSSVISYLKLVTRIHQKINDSLIKKDIGIIRNAKDLEEVSMLLGLYLTDFECVPYFKHNGMDLKTVLDNLRLSPDFLEDLSAYNYDPKLLVDHYSKYILKDSNNKSGSNIGRYLFDNSINDSFAIESITASIGKVYDVLKEEVTNLHYHVVELTVSERAEQLAKEPVEAVVVEDMPSVLRFGNDLTEHSEFIHKELPRLVLQDTNVEALKSIEEVIKKINIPEKEEPSKLSKFFQAIFGSYDIEDEEDINIDDIKELRKTVTAHELELSKEVLAYIELFKYIEVYRRKCRLYYLEAKEAEKKLLERLQTLDPNRDGDYAAYLECSTAIQVMRSKENRFATTNQLLKQELVKIAQIISNHSTTINALQMASGDFIPLILTELTINKGTNSEREALRLSGNIMRMFESMLQKNVEDSERMLIELKNNGLSSETYSLLERGLIQFIDEVDSTPVIADYDIDYVEPSQLEDNNKELKK